MRLAVYGLRGIPSTYSGYETFMTALLPELVRRGHSITIFCRKSVLPNGQDTWNGVRRVYAPSLGTKQLDTLTHGFSSAVLAAGKPYNAIVVCNVSNALPCLVGRLTGTPHILNTDGQEWLRDKWGLLGKLYFYFSARTARYCSNLLSDSNAIAEIYRRDFRARSTVIPYAWTGLTIADDAGDELKNWKVQPGNYYLAAGRMVPENNLDRIAQAYLGTGRKQPLLIAGSANYESPTGARICQLARVDERIQLIGHVSDRVAYATLLRHARALIHGHSVGGTNPGLIEAMGVGAAIVALDTPFNRETLGKAGLYTDHFTDFRERLIQIERCDQEVREAAKERARNHYSLATVADAYEDLIERVATSRHFVQFSMRTPWTDHGARNSAQSRSPRR